MTQLPAEFALIDRHFRPLAGEGSLGLVDDAAILSISPGTELVIAADAMVENVHFLPTDPPHDLGRKLLRCNLSDLAAMGADPLGYLLTISVPSRLDDVFFSDFAAGLALDQAEFGVRLLGGDTTSTDGPLAMSLTILGTISSGTAIRRSGARPGDVLFVTGTIGDGALGLLALRGALPDPDGYLADRYHLPRPRLGVALAGVAHAAIDVSDGLLQDAENLCRASGLALDLDLDRVPLSPQARAAGPAHREAALTGGDDYELLIAIPPDAAPLLAEQARGRSCPLTEIGTFREGAARLRAFDDSGAEIRFEKHGFSHF